MKRYQLKFLAWTFSAFLSPDDHDAETELDCYALLDVPTNANADDIKKAYKKRSLQLHPDKLRQRGMIYQGEVITDEEARSRFQQMKAAYDVLSDPKKRKIYDILGHKGMDFVLNPSHAWDPHVLLANLAKSSMLDRAKLMTLIVVFFGLLFLQPILVCAKVDQMLEQNGGALENASWVALLIPFWLFVACFGVLLIIGQAALPLLQLISIALGVLFLTLKFDKVVYWDYAALFAPFYVWMLLRLLEAKIDIRTYRACMAKMVTIEFIEKFVINEKKQDENGNDIEDQLHRTYNDLNEEERDSINKEFIIVHVPPRTQDPGEDGNAEEDDFEKIERSPEYQEVVARLHHAYKSIQRIFFPDLPLMVLIIVQLDMNKGWNWGLIFLPVWIAMFFDCCGGCYGFFCTSAFAHMEVQEALGEHIAKAREAKKNGGDDSKDSEKVNLDAEKMEGAHTNANDTTNGKQSESNSTPTPNAASETEVSTFAKSSSDIKSKIDTAVRVTESVDVKANREIKEPEGVEEDDEFMFEMDEDTFHFYQQAEQEAEGKAVEARSKAIGRFCNLIFEAILASLFVAKLNQVYEESDYEDMDGSGTSSFSTFWILFPFLLCSGCIICCFSCAIFGASSIDSAMASEDDGKNSDNDGGDAQVTASDTGVIPISPLSFSGEAKEKYECESTAQTNTEDPKQIDIEGNGSPAKEATVDEESVMDDLD
ncbi:hypothetical protein ACHAXA_000815 [Cyclostephanos tholiformis]|uniref:J domain-containing protein n=1 Tax=Cyclostephanos tholiformis TaxID=382380 RepID=A0ABD3RWC9_9STRA